MSDQRILSAEQLERALWDVGDDKSECEIRLHIAALTEQHAAELARVTAELEQGHAAYQRLCDSLEIAGNDLARVTKERDEAVENEKCGYDTVNVLTDQLNRLLAAFGIDRPTKPTSWSLLTTQMLAELAALKAERAEDTARLATEERCCGNGTFGVPHKCMKQPGGGK